MLPPATADFEEGGLPATEEVFQQALPENLTSPTGTQKTETRSPSLAVTDAEVAPSLNLSDKAKKKPSGPEYLPEDIPPEYREKPQFPYSQLIATALRAHPEASGISLSEIYKSIQDIFPYYRYCPHGWKHSVRHNLSSNKAFQKISKEDKGWLWGIDEEYFQKRERLKEKSATNSKPKPKAKQEHSKHESNPTIQDTTVAPQARSKLSETSQSQPEARQLPIPSAVLHESTHHLLEDTNAKLPAIKKEKVKTIAEIAREIRIEGTNDRLYRPAYSKSEAVEHIPAVTSKPSSSSETATFAIAQNEAILNTPRYKQMYPTPVPFPPIPPSMSGGGSNPLPSVVKSLADGQGVFRMAQVPKLSRPSVQPSPSELQKQTSVLQMRVNPQVPRNVRQAAQPSDDVRVLPKIQQHAIKHQMRASLPHNQNDKIAKSRDATPVVQDLQPKPAANHAQMTLPKDTLRALNLLQEKIKAQMVSSGQPINSAVLTNALAIAIGQLAKRSGEGVSGPNALASLLKGKNKAQLIGAITAAIGSARNPGPGQKPKTQGIQNVSAGSSASSSYSSLSTPKLATALPTSPPSVTKVSKKISPESEASVTTSLGDKSEPSPNLSLNPIASPDKSRPLSPAGIPPASSDIPTATPNVTPVVSTTKRTTAINASASGTKPKAEVIAEMLIKASKLTNPSPSIRAALVQLQAHAVKLGLKIPDSLLKMNNSSTSSALPVAAPIPAVDNNSTGVGSAGGGRDLKRKAENASLEDGRVNKVQKTNNDSEVFD